MGEMADDDRVAEEEEFGIEEEVTMDAVLVAEQAPIRHYPKPVIPPLWEVVNLPGPMHYHGMNSVDTTIATPTTETVQKRDNIDDLSDEAFHQWRQANPRATESMMAERYASDNPLANHFINSFLDSSSDDSDTVESSSDEEVSEREGLAAGGEEFEHEFNRLFRNWRAHHS